MAELFVFDTSAWITLDEGEPGAIQVEKILAETWIEQAEVYVSFVTLTELEYIRTRERDAEQAAELLSFAKAQPVSWVQSDDMLCGRAAKLKAAHKISLADAFIVALAQQLDATLVHKDPEIAALGSLVRQLVLPMKASQA